MNQPLILRITINDRKKQPLLEAQTEFSDLNALHVETTKLVHKIKQQLLQIGLDQIRETRAT